MLVKKIAFRDDIEWSLPSDPDEFMAWWRLKVDLIPPEYRGDSSIEMTSYSEFGDTGISLEIAYMGEETEAELVARTAMIAQASEVKEARDIAKMEAIAYKYNFEIKR